MNIKLIGIFLSIFLIKQFDAQSLPVVPLTNALTAIYCHKDDEPGIMTIRCSSNEKIRMLDAFDATVQNKSHLPIQCLKTKNLSTDTPIMNCKVHTSFTSACSGRENCTLHMQRTRLNDCQNEFVDYTMAFFECISDVFIHNVCSSQTITSAWGTLQTPNFPNPYTSNDDCWCKLSTQFEHRLLLSIIVFQLIPYDQQCAGAGLYLQSSNQQRSTQCTYLQQGHNYLSDTNSLYINFYSRTPTVRGGFWIIYEASHPKAEVHLHCGEREQIGIPSSIKSAPVSTPFDHGWSYLPFNTQTNLTTTTISTPINNYMMRSHLSVTTPYTTFNINSKINTSTAIGAFTYPHGALTTFQVAYGPRGWYLRYSFESLNKTFGHFFRPTTAPLPIVKWNFTWRYTRPQRTRLFKTTTTPIIMTDKAVKSTTIEPSTTILTSTSTTTIITQTVTAQQRLLFTHKPWIYYNPDTSKFFTTTTTTTTVATTITITTTTTTVRPVLKSTTNPLGLFSVLKTTLVPTPWYSPAGPYDWWQWQWYTTKAHKLSRKIHLTQQTFTTPTKTTTTITTFYLTNRTSTIPTNTNSQTTFNWFNKPFDRTSVSMRKQPITDDFDKEYKEWLEYFTSEKIHESTTSPPTTTMTTSTTQKQYSSFVNPITNSNWKIVTINTPPSKRQHSQPNHIASERNAIATYTDEPVTQSNVHNMIRRVIEQRNKKSSMEYGWLSKTDMTIVGVSVLFVILLAIINLILFAVRRHRHRLQGRHLLSTSISSTFEERRLGGNGHSNGSSFGDTTNSLINVTNTNNNDILPAVGEIVIWDEKDQGGYMIDNNGTWAKIEGRQWFGSGIFKSCSKTSLSKSFRSRFRFIRHLDKKGNNHSPAPIAPKTPQQTFKFPLLMDTATLSPVPEADDYDSSELSLSDVIIRSSATTNNHASRRHQQQPLIKHDLSIQNSEQTTKTIQAFIHDESQQRQQQNDDYYKRIGNNVDESNYGPMPGTGTVASSIGDQETDRSLGNEMEGGGPVVLSVPTIIRSVDEIHSNTDLVGSNYNPNYSIQSFVEQNHVNYVQTNNPSNLFSNKPSISTFKPPPHPTTTTNSIVVGFCQTDFQPLDPKLLYQSNEKCVSLIEQQQQYYRCSQSGQLSTYDSGFVDDQTIESLTIAHPTSELENNFILEQKNQHSNIDEILLTKSEDVDDETDSPINNGFITNEIRDSNRQKWKTVAKHVSFQEENVTERTSPPTTSFNTTTNPDTCSHLFDTYDLSVDAIQPTSPAPTLLRSFVPTSTIDHSATSSSIFTVQKQATTSIDNDDNTQTIIMNHLHSVKSLKKFFETKMVVQRPVTSVTTACSSQPPISSLTTDEEKHDQSSNNKEQKSIDELEQRQEMMNKVLESLKKKKIYSRTTNDTPEPNGRCSAMTNSSYESNLTQNLPVQRHYSRRFRSSSTSNNSLYPGGNIITHINFSNSHHNKRAHSYDRQYYQTTEHSHMNTIDKWKHDQQQQQIDSDEEDNISENSMLWQARTKLNEFVTRAKKHQQQQQQSSPYYTTCTNNGVISEDFYTFDDNESVTAETRF